MIEEATSCGQPASFGVEFARARSWPYIHVRLWIAGSWVGDIDDSLMPEPMCATLLRLGCPLKYPKFTYLSDAACPTFEEMCERGRASFGESFDPFQLDYYSVLATMRIHLFWQLSESYYYLFPDYPRHKHHSSVTMTDYRLAIRPFIAMMIDEGYYNIRLDLPTLSDLDSQENT